MKYLLLLTKPENNDITEELYDLLKSYDHYTIDCFQIDYFLLTVNHFVGAYSEKSIEIRYVEKDYLDNPTTLQIFQRNNPNGQFKISLIMIKGKIHDLWEGIRFRHN